MTHLSGRLLPLRADRWVSLQQTGFTFLPCHHDTLWALTPLISPLPPCGGSFVSVALSLGLPPVAVSNCLVLCCPDFPLIRKHKRSSSNLTHSIIPYNRPYGKGRLWASSTLLTMASASVLNSRPTCTNPTCLNLAIMSFIEV